MNKEQEEIIQRVNSDIDSPLSGGYTTIVLTDDLEEILNTLKEKDAEINKYKRKNKELSNQLLKIYKEQDNYNARIEKKDKIIDLRNKELKIKEDELKLSDEERIKLHKMIDLMAEYISNLDIDEDICKEQSDNNCDDINREVECKDCIKHFFERKAE